MVDKPRLLQTAEIARGLKPLSLPYPERVVYAGASSRRTKFVADIFSNVPVSTHDIEPEPRDTDTSVVMRYKVKKAYLERELNENTVILGADTRTLTPVLDDQNRIRMVSRGKPSNDLEVAKTFMSINEVAKATGEQPWYQVENTSGMIHHNNVTGEPTFLEDRDDAFVMLKREGVEYLATPAGMNEYMNQFREFYGSHPYDPSKHITTPFDLSGGISLPVLVRMNLVDNVNGISPDTLLFYKALRQAIYTVAVGISPRILEPVGIDSTTVIKHWDWINQVTKKSMRIM